MKRSVHWWRAFVEMSLGLFIFIVLGHGCGQWLIYHQDISEWMGFWYGWAISMVFFLPIHIFYWEPKLRASR